MIFVCILCLLITSSLIVNLVKNNTNVFILLWLGLIVISILLIDANENKLIKIKENIENYENQIIEIKAEQYDIKDKNNTKYKKNEEKLIKLKEKCNNEKFFHNSIMEKDEKKLFIFRWYINNEKYKKYEIKDEVITEFIAPDYYRG